MGALPIPFAEWVGLTKSVTRPQAGNAVCCLWLAAPAVKVPHWAATWATCPCGVGERHSVITREYRLVVSASRCHIGQASLAHRPPPPTPPRLASTLPRDDPSLSALVFFLLLLFSSCSLSPGVLPPSRRSLTPPALPAAPPPAKKQVAEVETISSQPLPRSLLLLRLQLPSKRALVPEQSAGTDRAALPPWPSCGRWLGGSLTWLLPCLGTV